MSNSSLEISQITMTPRRSSLLKRVHSGATLSRSGSGLTTVVPKRGGNENGDNVEEENSPKAAGARRTVGRCKSLSNALVHPTSPKTPNNGSTKLSLRRMLIGNLQQVSDIKVPCCKSTETGTAKPIKKRSPSSSKRHRRLTSASTKEDDIKSTASENIIVKRSSSHLRTTRLRVVTAQDLRLAIEANQKASALSGDKRRVIRRKSAGAQFHSTEDVLVAYSDIMEELTPATKATANEPLASSVREQN